MEDGGEGEDVKEEEDEEEDDDDEEEEIAPAATVTWLLRWWCGCWTSDGEEEKSALGPAVAKEDTAQVIICWDADDAAIDPIEEEGGVQEEEDEEGEEFEHPEPASLVEDADLPFDANGSPVAPLEAIEFAEETDGPVLPPELEVTTRGSGVVCSIDLICSMAIAFIVLSTIPRMQFSICKLFVRCNKRVLTGLTLLMKMYERTLLPPNLPCGCFATLHPIHLILFDSR